MKSYQIFRNNKKKTQDMTLRDYYESIESAPSPRMDFLKDVAEACGVNAYTVKNWMLGMTPKQESKKNEYAKIISMMTGLDENKIFVK